MTVVVYTAIRELAPGHLLGSSQTFEFSTRVLSQEKKTIGEESVSLSGKTQSVLSRRDEFWIFETNPMLDSSQAYLNMSEFLESVDFYERFIIDIDGTVAQPINQIHAKLDGNYQRVRLGQNPQFTFRFKVKILP